MQRATPADLPAIRSFLERRITQTMFHLSNLDRFGLDGDHPYAPSMWFATKGDDVTGVLTIGKGGMVMPALPGMEFEDAAHILRGRDITGVIGPKDQSRALLRQLGLDGVLMTLNRDEPHFDLDLSRLTVPDGPGLLHPLEDADRDEMIGWRAAYGEEALGMAPEAARADGERAVDQYIEHGSHRVLMHDHRALATTGFNAWQPTAVQIGGVYTPPDLRGRGHARRALALHLAEARDRGVQLATLFAASDSAARAYVAIGFERIGDWTLALFSKPERYDG
ncbi:GNAT family N-acetyltransferase [Loktanella sp. IMCC34160]|uniref:GNAT family N-acetyltransferase n=1 Tax=Loktanella sp. IMCC34160 TaxID=2510646 RepID=UPI00101C5167|nr:GNAT family N-acetyltransferase [Loktanella sp. IMCC34160]RYG90440.1 GNAT family N-acetyltransferase [Loktanella sp. IMCC34160]